MMQERYELIKLSSPGFKLERAVPRHCRKVLEMFVCEGCMTPDTLEDESIRFPSDYKTLSEEDKIAALLSTACGCEFHFSTWSPDYE